MNNSLKQITIFDKIRAFFNKFKEPKNFGKFMIETEPILKNYSDIELMKIANIEEKLKNIININKKDNILSNGITKDEAENLLNWIVQNARKGLEKEYGQSLKNASLRGYCGLAQGISAITLENMGLSPYITNVNPTFSNNSSRHAFVTVEFPISQPDGKIKNVPYLVDTTYRQFFTRDEWTNFKDYYVNDKKYGNKVATIAGYWTLKMENGKYFTEELLSKGFIELTEENAKIYGDSFVLQGIERKNPTKVPKKNELTTKISGKTYIENMFNYINQENIDYQKEELEEANINIKTPAMVKEEFNETILKRENLINQDKVIANDKFKDKNNENKNQNER